MTATALRLWILRKHVDRRLLWSFGLMSAAGGLVGSLLHAYANSPVLTIVFGVLLVFTVGALLGTVIGQPILGKIPEKLYRRLCRLLY